MERDEMKAARARLGLTQVQLAAELGVHPITVSRWETGERGIPEPTARLVRRLVAERRAKRKS
jgi:transcriptional regulator with XRE-family HTH domain